MTTASRNGSALTYFSRARTALQKASSIDEVKDVRDKAEALRAYHKQVGASHEMQNQCAEIKVRAERRAGELLFEMRERGERVGQHGGDRSRSLRLQDLGIDKHAASRWQTIARLPEERFEGQLAETKATRRRRGSRVVLNPKTEDIWTSTSWLIFSPRRDSCARRSLPSGTQKSRRT